MPTARDRLNAQADAIAPLLLGSLFSHHTASGRVTVRLTEVEAYLGADDPGSHAFRGPTPRTAPMFGPPGRLYVYFSYGMHWCANVVAGPNGKASACLLRAGEIVDGIELARRRRPTARRDTDLARGPANLAAALGITGELSGAEIAVDFIGPAPLPQADALTLRLRRRRLPAARVASGPRVGVSGAGGDGKLFPLRFWVRHSNTVSTYRPAQRHPLSHNAAKAGRGGLD